MDQPQLLVNETVSRDFHDGFGEVRQARPAARFSATPAAIAGPGPRLGEHNVPILLDLGYPRAAIEAFHSSGVLAPETDA